MEVALAQLTTLASASACTSCAGGLDFEPSGASAERWRGDVIAQLVRDQADLGDLLRQVVATELDELRLGGHDDGFLSQRTNRSSLCRFDLAPSSQ